MTNYHDEILNFEKIAQEHTQYMRNSINLIASEKITKNNNLDQIYQYVYEKNKLVQKICICDKSNKIPTTYYYSYDKDGRMIEEYTMYSFKW